MRRRLAFRYHARHAEALRPTAAWLCASRFATAWYSTTQRLGKRSSDSRCSPCRLGTSHGSPTSQVRRSGARASLSGEGHIARQGNCTRVWHRRTPRYDQGVPARDAGTTKEPVRCTAGVVCKMKTMIGFAAITALLGLQTGCMVSGGAMAGVETAPVVYDDDPPYAYTREAPPTTEVEVPPPAPGPDFVWVAGEWAWNPAGRWEWRAGRWARAEPGSVWVPGRWEQRDEGRFAHVKGHWERRGDTRGRGEREREERGHTQG